MRARRSATAHPLLDAARPAEPAPGRRAISARRSTATCSSPATPMSRRSRRTISPRRPVRELHALRPDRMKVVPGADGWPEAYEYSVGGRTVRFAIRGRRLAPILHLSLFHPLDDHYGFAPIEAAAVALDMHNAAGAWNKALLDNSARPSGALVYQAKDGGNLSAEQFERLKRELESSFAAPPCRPAAAARRRARLEGDGAVAEGHGLHGGQERRGARDRARLRRAADAARHPRRQHLFELPGGQPRLLARHRAAAGRRASPRRSAPGWRRPSAPGGCAARLSTPTRSTRLRPSARRCGRGSAAAEFLTVNEKRAAVGYGPVEARRSDAAERGSHRDETVDEVHSVTEAFSDARRPRPSRAVPVGERGERRCSSGAAGARRLEPAVQRLRRRDRAAQPLLRASD